MVAEILCRDHLEALARFLQETDAVPLAVLDRDRAVRAMNGAFAETVHVSDGAVGRSLDELFTSPAGEPLALPEAGESARLRTKPVRPTDAVAVTVCHVVADEAGYLVFPQHPTTSDDQVLMEVSNLNAQLTDLTRQLKKKQEALEQANETIKQMARTDELTGLANRRHFNERLSEELSAGERHGHPLSLVMADLDHFKQINDRFGHDVGDEVLAAFAEVLKETCRREDLPARTGGEEFLILLPQIDADGAAALAERVREAFEAAAFDEPDLSPTASLGATEWQAGEDTDTLLRRVDAALYKAKEAGRNRVVTAHAENATATAGA